MSLLPALSAPPLLQAQSESSSPVGRIETPLGEILVYLYPQTPHHRDSFIKLAKAHYWDSLTFNRVVRNFVVQGGCPDTPAGFKDSPYNLAPEFRPELRHDYGVFAAGRDNNPQMLSAGCQFYIVINKAGEHRLDDKYTIYGKVIKGMDVAEKMVLQPQDSTNKPDTPIGLKVDVIYLTSAELAKYGVVPK
ncbi:MAG TPA: peptidylprolyl isomerase [Gemmatimonadales bacterium]|nr:peptidylprolyl isomerase [Gemmatimonadales bacterium]